MRKIRKLSFQELVSENRDQLLNDKEAMEKIEERWEQRHISKKLHG
ncbi:FbpB family small basic protein [Halalkalibacterium halodurans]|jgi:hypothetical protein|uniref:BH2296 protein n=1 Tax=Halalkalibacterium halodurans (strain ATCC BAA-125 / DSM 18197 / FERM 7344 / JCM 9153 / C-125) TaxID=272558 RepID=Q9KAJ1_HALH5|nr:FbpB family small basic protein [Halalkalibacterium halodurans]MDY7222847.1 FbpB family small basic protein [Halalkalibacterium halodurans]MDY7242068.1 FbpB family small basic protein [Halalkalibacterium halodurans]MED3648561.1 FbpB family small basic protein [Halalkalibacterium halodurans]MED4080922.1 FbpB family small basic protein [Halalkalibacterium halodurans]MED4085105.1 FbpB family small basic protein [Halalkalibacterium halodurans]